MAYEQKDNSGSLFKNDRKEQPNHPDYRGSAMIDGREYWVSAWIKEGAKGKWMSFSYQPKDEQQPRQQQRKAPPAENFDNGDIPF